MILSIIIPTFNTKGLILNCLKSIFNNPPKSSFEVIVIDNASNDNTANMIRKNFPKVHLIQNSINVGYAKANNQALKIARGKYILLLNSDIQIKKDNIQNLIDFIYTPKNAGAVAAKLINPDGSTQYYYHRRFPTFVSFAASLIENHLNISTPASQNYFMLKEKFDKEIELDQAATSALIVKKDILKKIGGLFDKNLPLFFNDTDLSKRIRKSGFKIILAPHIKIVHLKNKTTDLLDPFIIREELFISMLYYFKKHKQIFSYLTAKISLIFLLATLLTLSLINLSKNYLGISRQNTQSYFKKQVFVIFSVILEKRHISSF